MDSKEPQQYRLKPGIDLRITDLKDGLSFVHYQDDYVQWETEHVNAIFETIDEDAIRKQITEILNNGFGDSTHFIESNNLCVDRILEVTLGGKQ